MLAQNLTLLIPMYNKAPYIERMVESLSKQTYLPRTKIIVTDDCSTDNSIEILKRSAEKFHVPMLLRFNRKNLGLSMTIRNFYRIIETPFWAVLDSDDYYIHPERLERAVKFLEANPDHSMHGCNFFYEYPDRKRVSTFPESVHNFSADNLKTLPFFQTSASTFRNFWTPELLLEIDRLAGKNRFHFTEGDSFRNFCAIHFGKAYLDNFFGSVYTMQVGSWDTMSTLEKNVLGIDGSYKTFEFARDFFHNAQSANFSLSVAYAQYLKVSDQISVMFKDRSALKFQGSNYFKTVLQVPKGNFEDILRVMFEYCRKFEELGMHT